MDRLTVRAATPADAQDLARLCARAHAPPQARSPGEGDLFEALAHGASYPDRCAAVALDQGRPAGCALVTVDAAAGAARATMRLFAVPAQRCAAEAAQALWAHVSAWLAARGVDRLELGPGVAQAMARALWPQQAPARRAPAQAAAVGGQGLFAGCWATYP